MSAIRLIINLCLLTTLVNADAEIRWRSDHRCGPLYTVRGPNNTMITGECNPDAINPCCSQYDWCGDTSDYCHCNICIDYKERARRQRPETEITEGNLWRPDHRCGNPYLVMVNGGSESPAECNPHGGNPCCSFANWCGDTAEHCDCTDCIDYSQSTNPAPAGSIACSLPYQNVAGKCMLYSNDGLTWSEADLFCRDQGGRLITFSSLDQLMEVVGNFTLLEISKETSPDLEAPYWVGLTTLGRQREQDQGLQWRWIIGTIGEQLLELSQTLSETERCSFLLPKSTSTISHNGDCSALKLPLCELAVF